MKVFVAGATGVIGRRLVPILVGEGHEVVGTSRSDERARALGQQGARGVVADVFDRGRLQALLADEEPEVVIDELSDLPGALGPGGDRQQFAGNVRVRTEGTRNLVDASLAAGVRRIIAQSYAHVYAPEGDWVKTEEDPLNLGPDVPPARRRNVEAVRDLEGAVLEKPGIEGIALRYGAFYGPGTAYAADGSIAQLARIRHYPIVGRGQGRTSFIHVDDAAAATVLALQGPPGVYNICDDEPAPMAEWVPVYAQLLRAPAPRHVPAIVERMFGREHLVYRATEQRGASNDKAKRLLGFAPAFATWRQGFAASLAVRAAA